MSGWEGLGGEQGVTSSQIPACTGKSGSCGGREGAADTAGQGHGATCDMHWDRPWLWEAGGPGSGHCLPVHPAVPLITVINQ